MRADGSDKLEITTNELGTSVAHCHICHKPMNCGHNSLCWVTPFKQEIMAAADRYAAGDKGAREELEQLLTKIG